MPLRVGLPVDPAEATDCLPLTKLAARERQSHIAAIGAWSPHDPEPEVRKMKLPSSKFSEEIFSGAAGGVQASRLAPFASQIRTGNPGLMNRAGSLVGPLLSVASLFALVCAFEAEISPKYLALALTTFLALFPGKWANNREDLNVGTQVLTPWVVTSALLLFVGYVTGYVSAFPPVILVLWLLITPLAQGLALLFLPSIMGRLVRMRRPAHRIVIVGVNALGLAFGQRVQRDPTAHSSVVAYFDDRLAARLSTEIRAEGSLKELTRYTKEKKINQIYIALPIASQPRIIDLLESLRDSTASIYFLPDLMSMDLIQPRMDTQSGFPVVGLCESPFSGANMLAKQTMDIVLATIALIVLAPAMAVIALAIKLTSKGPIIFRQRRFGLDGTDIYVWKFRTMSVTEDGATQYIQVQPNDPRVTKLGSFLRKTSLDELPQLINVLQGKMSIVGPRPHAIKVNEVYRHLVPGYMVRHKVKPGITGWAQVNGYRGGDDLVSMTKRIEFDLDYLRRWSIWLDLRILCKTALLVAKDSHAF